MRCLLINFGSDRSFGSSKEQTLDNLLVIIVVFRFFDESHDTNVQCCVTLYVLSV